MKGRIIKNQNGYFSILGESGSLSLCRSRGRLKRRTDVLVGDMVEYEIPSPAGEAMLTHVYPRKTTLHRPMAANIDLLILTSAVRTPDVNLYTLDKMILMAEAAEIDLILCFNKMDLDPEQANALEALYARAGYPVVCTSMETGEGLERMRSELRGHIIAFSGPSGVGKSSLINHFLGKNRLVSGQVSARTGRGKNTTRHAELIPCEGGSFFLMDTPGYTSFDLENIPPEHLDYLFREFRHYIGHCRFADCQHINEPDCAVKEAVQKEAIALSRYRSYCQALEEVREISSRY